MQHPDSTAPRTVRRLRRTAFGLVGVVVAASGIAAGGEAAFADDATGYTDLQTAFTNAAAVVDVRNDIDASGSTLTLAGGASTVLNLHGHTLRLDTLQLTTVDQTTLTAVSSSLSVTGGGSLIVNHSSDTGTAAIEVDANSSLTLDDVSVSAGFGVSNATAAAIGGGQVGGSAQTAGTITIQDGANVAATGSTTGAAIGGGNRGGGGTINISDSSLTATSTGNAAAIGGGANPANGAVGSLNASNHAVVSATASGAGSAIGGGLAGGGGTVNVYDFARVTADARAGQVGIGDGPGADQSTTLNTNQSSAVVAIGGNGAGIGSATGAAGGDQININDRSSVTASAVNGPGVGGGSGNTQVSSVQVNGSGSLSATGGGNGAGVGAGTSTAYGTSLSIGSDASAVVGAAAGVSAIGGTSGARFGTISNNGSLTLPSGTIVVPLGAQLSSSGTFVNNGTVTVKGEFVNGGSITNNGTFDGNGFISNSGTIIQYGTLNTLVEGSYYDVKYDSQGGSVSPVEQFVAADSFQSAAVTVPTATPPSVGSFSGWNTSPDGTGATLNSRVSLSSIASPSTNGLPTELRVYALYQLVPVLRTTVNLPQAVVGNAYSASVAATSGTAPITYTYTGDLPAGLSIDLGSGLITGTPTTSGTFTMHLLARNAAGPTSHDYTIQVVATVLHVAAPQVPKAGARYLAGGRFDATLSGLQANESYTVTIGGTKVASGRAPTNQAFSVRTTIPKSIGDGTQSVRLTGADHALGSSTTILTASVSKSLGLKLSAKKVKHGKKIVVTVSKLYAGESARIVISGKHGKVNVGKASSKGAYTLTLKKGLAKGKYTVTVTGAGTGRKASAKLTVS